MCGLSGAAGYVTDQEKKVVADLLVLNVVRGIDSTGIGVVPRDADKDFLMCRALGTPYGDGNEAPGLFNYLAYERTMKTVSKVVLGHNRAATKGHVTVRNAHPFKFSNVMGIHNGTLYHNCLKSLEELLGTGEKFDTDSELIFACINAKGFPETIKLMQGAWALVWYDKRDNTLNFCRNKERTLHYIMDESEKALFWSSDFSPLMYAIHRQKIQTGDKKPKLFPEDMWVKFKIPEVAVKFEEATQEEAKGFTYQATNNYSTCTTHQNGTTNRRFYSNGSDVTDCYYDNKSRTWIEKPKGANWVSPDDLPFDSDNEQDVLHAMHQASTSYSVDRSEVRSNDNFAARNSAPKDNRAVIVHQQQGQPSALDNVARQRIWNKVSDKANQLFLTTYAQTTVPWILKHMEAFERVYYDDKNEQWHVFKYFTATGFWDHLELPHPPNSVPFRKVNVDAGGCHHFKVVGSNKKRNRMILYRGFNKSLLAQSVFEKIMAKGCINCQRVPSWGNLVRFFSHNTFLCEHCEKMPSVVRMVGELEVPRKAL